DHHRTQPRRRWGHHHAAHHARLQRRGPGEEAPGAAVGLPRRPRPRLPVDAADVRPARLLVPPGARDPHVRLVDGPHRPDVHARQLPRGPDGRHRAGRVLRQLVRHRHPVGGHPDLPGAAGVLRLRLDRVPRQEHLLRDRLRAADRPDPG
ncbi:MAG: Alpha-glucoside transport system permease protein AglG, partial [uncultured Friedmanniella sp.]